MQQSSAYLSNSFSPCPKRSLQTFMKSSAKLYKPSRVLKNRARILTSVTSVGGEVGETLEHTSKLCKIRDKNSHGCNSPRSLLSGGSPPRAGSRRKIVPVAR